MRYVLQRTVVVSARGVAKGCLDIDRAKNS